MPKVKLTAAFVQKVACPPNLAKIDDFDSKLVGFMPEVRCSSKKPYW